MANTANINTTKTTLITLATVLALAAAALVPARAEAAIAKPATAKVPTGAIEDAKPMPGQGVKAVKVSSPPKTQSPTGAISARGTITQTNGVPGSISKKALVGLPHWGGYQMLTSVGANVSRSPSYTGTQVITMRTNIFKADFQNGQVGSARSWAHPTYSVYARSGQYAVMPSEWYKNADLKGNMYRANIQVWWQTPDGRLLAYRSVELNHLGDYACASGTEGSGYNAGCARVGTSTNAWLRMDYWVGGGQ